MFRRLQLLILSVVLVVAAFSTGYPFLFFLIYLALLVGGGSYILTRLGLSDLEAGYAVSQLSGHVGDKLRVTYTLRNTGRVPKPWLEIYNPTTLPGGLPGRALSLRGRQERSWLVRTPLVRRGHFRIEPLMIRTGDPFGFFEASAGVGQGVTLVVYPRVDALPMWRLPPASVEGAHATPERTLQTTPLVSTVRPYAPGDSMNRIHWPTTARLGEIQVKEFDLEQTADAWLFLDLDASTEAGEGERSTTEVGVRAAASIADKALGENRAVGMSTSGHRLTVLPADRGARQRLKILQLLAAVEADGRTPLAEALVTGRQPPAAGDDGDRDHRDDGPVVRAAARHPALEGHRDGGGAARPGGVRAARRRGGRRGRTPAEPRRASRAGRVRGAGLDHRP